MGGTNKTDADEGVFTSVNNYPFWCSHFEQDLHNYYQPPNPPLELYVGAGGDFNCCHPDSHSHFPDYCQHYPNYHAHYLNYRHVVAQINARYHPKTIPFAPDWVDWISLDKEKDCEKETDCEVERRCGGKTKMCKTGMFLAGRNVMFRHTTLELDEARVVKPEEQHWATSKLFKAHR